MEGRKQRGYAIYKIVISTCVLFNKSKGRAKVETIDATKLRTYYCSPTILLAYLVKSLVVQSQVSEAILLGSFLQ